MFTVRLPRPSGFWGYLWPALAIGGGLVWAWSVSGAYTVRAWQALLVNFLFFTSLAAGLAVWPVIADTCNGTWHRGLDRPAAAGLAFALPSLGSLLLLWIGSRAWSPWFGKEHHQGLWLSNSFLFLRNIAVLVLFWYLVRRYRLLEARGIKANGPLVILAYALALSLIGFDLVMGLDPHWFSTLAGGYFFITALYIGMGGWTFLAVLQGAGVEQRHDLGRLLVAFSLMSTYLMYSHLLPIWYENLPHEVRFVLPRMKEAPWQAISFFLLATVYFGPLVLLLTQWSKRRRFTLAAVSLLVLVGMWLERFWLVAPTLWHEFAFGVPEVACMAAFIGMFAIVAGRAGIPGHAG